MSDFEDKRIADKKYYLKAYRRSLETIDRLEERLSFLEMRMTSVRSPRIDGMPRGGEPTTLADLLAKKEELVERINRHKSKSADLRKRVYDEIDRLDDSRYIEVLEAIFIDGLDLDESADKLGYGRRHIQRLYSNALAKLVDDTDTGADDQDLE